MAKENQAEINPLQAVSAATAFLISEGQRLSPKEIAEQLGAPGIQVHPDLGTLVSFRGELGTIWVSERDNVVYYSGNSLGQADQPVSAAECWEIAKKMARKHVKDFEARNFIADQPNVDTTSFTIRWTEQLRPDTESAIFPNWVEVAVQIPSGRVTRFSASDLRLVRTSPPVISEAQARALIRKRFDKSAIEEIELLQQTADGGKTSYTIWTAMVMTLAPEGPVTVRVTLDADSGEIIPE